MPAFPARRKQVSMIGQTGVVLGGWAAMHETGIKIKKNLMQHRMILRAYIFP